jgi:hypothetical protein
MPSTLNSQSETPNVQGKQDHYLVSLERYGLQQPSAQQKLTPLDMNMPRLYGIRLVLCFPSNPGMDKLQMSVSYMTLCQTVKTDKCRYENLKKGLAHTVTSIPWISGHIASIEITAQSHSC